MRGNDEKLEAYARILEARIGRLEKGEGLKRGFFPINSKIEERQRILRQKVYDAIRAGKFWQIVIAEFRRDYSSLFDNLFGLEESIELNFDARLRTGSKAVGAVDAGGAANDT